jgi:hypothetical protein
MQQVITKSNTIKDNDKKDEKQKLAIKFNLWLSKIGKTLNTSQLSNYK